MDVFRTLRRAAIIGAQLLLAAPPVYAQQSPARDSAEVLAVHDAFHRALTIGDSTAVMHLLAPDVRILESGGSQTREEYRTEHLASDIAYAKAVSRTTTSVRITVIGDAAWMTSTSGTTGEFNGRPVNSLGVELMVLRRVTDAEGRRWVIAAVHWSSRRKPDGTG